MIFEQILDPFSCGQCSEKFLILFVLFSSVGDVQFVSVRNLNEDVSLISFFGRQQLTSDILARTTESSNDAYNNVGVIIVIIILVRFLILVLKMTKKHTHNMTLMSRYRGQ